MGQVSTNELEIEFETNSKFIMLIYLSYIREEDDPL